MPSKMKPGRLARAVSAVIDRLENRCLFAALVPSSSVLVFNSDANSGGANHVSHTDTLTITNTGSTTLTLSGPALAADPVDAAGNQSGDFHITSGSLPASLAAGASANVMVNFTASAVNTIESALLQINSSDTGNPVTTIQLHGLGTNGQFATNEPSLANILTSFDIPTNIGVTDPSNSQYPQTPSASSQEVALQRLVKAGTGPVTIQMLASFNASAAPSVRFGYYTPGNASGTTELFTINNADDQTVNPVAQGVTSFDPGPSSFGLYATFPGISTSNNKPDTHYTEDSLNTLDPTHSRKFRFFPLENSDGSTVPNAYVVAAEDFNDPTFNSFTNFVAIIRNVTAAPGAPHGAVLGLTNLDAVPGSNSLVFNRIQNLNPDDPNGFVDTVHDTNTLQITNTGDQTLSISGLTLSDTTNWVLVNPPTLPATVAPGGTLDVTIKFIATTNPSHTDNQTNDVAPSNAIDPSLTSVQAGGVWNGTLTITSNDAANPTKSVNLAGYWQYESEHETEPSLQTIVNKMFGFGTDIADSQLPEYPNNGSQRVLYGEEVYSPYWNVADPTLPVSVYQLDAYHNQYDPNSMGFPAAAMGYFAQGSSSTTVLFQDTTGESQSVLPIANGSSATPAQASFTPTGAFGWNLDGEKSDDTLNTTDMTFGRSGHSVRFWPARDSSGKVIPNEWIMGLDYQNSAFDNSDYQDVLYVVTNMHPAAQAPAPTSFQGVASTSGVSLQWSPVTDGSLQGYNLFRSTTPVGNYTQIASGLSGTSYVDTTAPQGATLYYLVAPVDSAGQSTGAGTIVTTASPGQDVLTSTDINTTPAGTTTIITPGTDYDVTGGAGDIGGTAADGFRYAYESVTGNFDVSVQVASVTQSVAGNSKAGIMARASLAPGSEMVFSGVTPTQGYRFNYRTVTDAVGTFNSVGSITYPNAWVRLTRSGDVFTAYSSTDGVNWTQIGTLTLSLPATIDLGLAADSHTTGQTLTAQFRHFSVSNPTSPPSTLGAPQGLTATADSSGITLQWNAETGAAGYDVLRSTSATGPFTQLNGSPLTGTSYADTAAPIGSTSFYEVVAVDGQGNISQPATTSAIRPGTSTPMPFGGRTVATYTDDAGHTVTLRLTGRGSGVATFVNGAATPDSITLTGTNAASIFTISVKGGTTHVGTIAVTGSIGRVAAPTTLLQGDLAVSGSLGSVSFAGASGAHTLSVGGGGRVASLSLGQVSDLSISSAVPIALLSATTWLNTGGTDLITAPSITRLAIAQTFAAELTLTGAGNELASASIRGGITGGAWSLASSAGQIVAGGVASTWSGTLGGTIAAFNTTHNFDGSLTAGAINSFHIGGNLTGAVRLTGGTAHDLRALSVVGAIDGGQVRAAGSIGAVTAAGLINADVFAGVANSVASLPATASNFADAASITSVVVTGRGLPFAVQGSNVAALTLGHVTFGAVNTNNGGVKFGLAAHSLASYTRKVNGAVLTWTSRQSPALLTDAGDATVRLV